MKKYSFGTFDALLIIAVVLLAVCVPLAGKQGRDNTVYIEYTLKTDNTEYMPEKGDAVVCGESCIGYVVSSDTGELVISVYAKQKDDGYYASGVLITPGRHYAYFTGLFAGDGVCTGITEASVTDTTGTESDSKGGTETGTPS